MTELASAKTTATENNQLTGLPELLDRAVASLNEFDQQGDAFAAELQSLQQRLTEGRFHLAILGQFKRGKSTLLNALLGDELLPTDILPVTAIPTYIKYGAEPTAFVYFVNRSEPIGYSSAEGSLADFLQEYVTEAGNPHNEKAVERVEISHPAKLLEQGVVLIDTPGIGSTLKHNTEVAHQILPKSDAALFLVSPDPPITEIELDYLGQIKQRLPRTFYLLNKVDFLDEREKVASLRFLGDQLSRFYAAPPEVMPISARKGLQAKLAGDETAWQQSGMPLVEQNLIDFFAREKQQTLSLAIARRSGDILGEAIMQLQLSLQALKLPEDELQSRIEQFRQSLPAIEREQQAAADVLAGDLKRAIKNLAEEIETLREQAKEKILAPLEVHFQEVDDPEALEQLVHDAIAAETGQFFASQMHKVSDRVRQYATELLKINQDRSNGLIEQVRQTASELFAIPYYAPAAGASYISFEAPAWSDNLFTSSMDPLGQKLSRKFFRKSFRLRRTIKRLREESRKLVMQNVEQISWALRKSLEESFRTFGANLREQLDKTIAATHAAMAVAQEKSTTHSRASADREVTYQKILRELEGVRAELTTKE